MDILIDLLIASLGTSYFLIAIEAFIDLGKVKGFVSLAFATGLTYLIGYSNYDLAVVAPATAFLSLAITTLLDRPTTIQPLRRF